MRNRTAAILSLATVVGVGLLIGESFEPNAGRSLPPLSRTPAAAAIDDAGTPSLLETPLSSSEALRRQLAAERAEHRAKLAKVVRLNRRHRAQARRYRSAARANGSVSEALTLASTVYGVDRSALSRVAWCESRHNPSATNGKYRGLFQWGPSWGSTSYAHLSPFSPYAAALATAERVSAHGWGWWECKP